MTDGPLNLPHSGPMKAFDEVEAEGMDIHATHSVFTQIDTERQRLTLIYKRGGNQSCDGTCVWRLAVWVGGERWADPADAAHCSTKQLILYSSATVNSGPPGACDRRPGRSSLPAHTAAMVMTSTGGEDQSGPRVRGGGRCPQRGQRFKSTAVPIVSSHSLTVG